MRLRKKLLLWLMQTRLYSWLLIHVIPYVRFTTYYTSLRGNKYHEGYKLLSPASIILAVDKKKLTSLLIPGTFTHAALCVNKRTQIGIRGSVVKCEEGDWEVVEMTHHNFTRSDFFDLCKEADRIVILNCLDWDLDYKRKVIDAAWSFKHATYDIDFDLGIKALYCSELVYQADCEADKVVQKLNLHRKRYKLGMLGCDLSDLAGLGRPYISPDGLLFAKNVMVIWDSDNQLNGMTGPECEKLLTPEIK